MLDEMDDNGAERPTLDGASVAAILLLLLDETDAAAILRDLDHDEVRLLARAMYDRAAADEETIGAALDLFVANSRDVSALSLGADTRIRSVVQEAVGNVRADNILTAVAPQSGARSLDMLRWMELEAIRSIVVAEHPQVGALILSALIPAVAAKVIEPLDQGHQTDLMLRAAGLSDVAVTAIEDLEQLLLATTRTPTREARQSVGGPSDVAKIIKTMPKPLSDKAIAALRKKDRFLAQVIEEEMFIFENLRDLPKKNLGAVLRGVDAKTLAFALKGADRAMAELCLSTMSKRAAETIRDEMADMTMVKRTDVDDAQRSIMKNMRQMVAAGEIILAGASDDYV